MEDGRQSTFYCHARALWCKLATNIDEGASFPPKTSFRRVSVDEVRVLQMEASLDARGDGGADCQRGRLVPENGYDSGPRDLIGSHLLECGQWCRKWCD